MLGKKEQIDYLLHRVGEEQLPSYPRARQKAIGGNVEAPNFLDTYGNSNILGYIGFIDLVGFSSVVKGYLPEEIRKYLNPFLVKVIDILYEGHALVDKMIGDEIMFFLPVIEEDEYRSDMIFLGQIMGALHDLAFEIQPKYKYRIGLSYGSLNVFFLKGKGYSEWSVVGEPVHVAKRLHSVEELKLPNPVCGAFGLPITINSIEILESQMKNILGMIAGFASHFDHKSKYKVEEFKGVGKVIWSYIFPKNINY